MATKGKYFAKHSKLLLPLVFLAVTVTIVASVAFAAMHNRAEDQKKHEALENARSHAQSLGSIVEDAAGDATEGKDSNDDSQHTFTIEYSGERYAYNNDLTVVLLLGIDRADHDQLDYLNGQCDAIAVAVMDNKTHKATVINIPRDTMGYIYRRTESGLFYDEQYAQLAIAHSFGVDDADSVNLAQRSISNFLYGVAIDKTVQFKVLGVSAANDLVGGVTVELLDDFTKLSFSADRSDPAMKKGETLTLTGEQAYLYVQYRDIHVPGSSFQRLQRQIQYAKAYLSKAKTMVKQNPTFVVTAFNKLKDYLYTNISMGDLVSLANQALAVDIHSIPIKTVEGELKQGKQFMEYYPDEAKLKELVLETFYTKL